MGLDEVVEGEARLGGFNELVVALGHLDVLARATWMKLG
jgi:hypothetical protein